VTENETMMETVEVAQPKLS